MTQTAASLSPALRHRLSATGLFQGLSEESLARVYAVCTRRKLPTKTTLFHEDDAGHALFVILSGRVVVERIAPDGEKIYLAERAAGDHVGEMSLLDDAPRAATVTTLEETEFLMLRRDDFHDLLQREPALARHIMRSLVMRLREANDRMMKRESLDLTGRIAALLAEKVRAETREGDGEHIFSGLTDRLIAERLGVARESVARRWERLEKLRGARRDGRNVIVLSVRRLDILAQNGGA